MTGLVARASRQAAALGFCGAAALGFCGAAALGFCGAAALGRDP